MISDNNLESEGDIWLEFLNFHGDRLSFSNNTGDYYAVFKARWLGLETGDSKQTTTGVDGQVQSAHLAGDTLILETDAQALAFVYQIEGEVNI